MRNFIIILLMGISFASCNSGNKSDEQARAIDSLKSEVMKKQIADSIAQAMAAQQAAPPNNEYSTMNSVPPAPVHHSSGYHSTGYHPAHTTNNYNTYTTTSAANAQPQHKKGWSAKAKGALIGAGAGAITGAMVDGRKGEGAVVGGILGAAAGTGVGAIIDKKQKNKQQSQPQR